MGPIPTKVLSAAPSATMSGWFHDLMPTLGIGFTW
jgi:hypothetical protein